MAVIPLGMTDLTEGLERELASSLACGSTKCCCCTQASICLTRWVKMQEAVPVTRPLQNHLFVLTHFTTQDAL